MGTTILDHRIRVKLKLNCLEYCVAEFLLDKKPFKYSAVDFLCITNNQLITCLDSLKEKEIIFYEDGKEIILLDKWFNEFKIDNSLAEELWKLHRYGNKPTVIKRLPKVLKKISFEELKKKLIAYLAACNSTNTSTKMLSTWVDPNKEHWLDPLPVARTQGFGVPNQPKEKLVNYTIIK